ncbi:MAG TPA: thioredoxin domain-containing protein, partial [Nitrospiria bacterium]|nr:thioredoxin domain-containing protein [Nitrospiria bacterium]
SPYLLQHAFNPVDWYPWGTEALAKAKKEGKPILLSIGYSACHWCHVMERESFENNGIADLMNQFFVNIKVDREERPDLDQIYQNAVQFFIRRGGGWPLTMFLTPAQAPFYGGTYFPPEERYNLPAFGRVLQSAARAWSENREEIEKSAQDVIRGLDRFSVIAPPPKADTSSRLVENAVVALAAHFNTGHGGFGGAPKFPNTILHELFLEYSAGSGDETFKNRALLTLRKMALGGIHDQLGGGFHRYSVDDKWLVPHFEKMLYDNALLVPLFLHGYQVSGESLLKKTAEDTLDYVLREMTAPEGGFYSSQDADSEGEEGKFFVWGYDEVRQRLPGKEGEVFCRYFDITAQGNFEGKNIPNIPQDPLLVANEFGLNTEKLEEIVEQGKRKLFEVREKRIKPLRDEKILTGWNALMISAFIEGFRITGEEKYLRTAEKGIAFIFSFLYRDGNLLAVYKDGKAKFNGYLDDYSYLTSALLDLFQVTGRSEFLAKAVGLTKRLIALFQDREGGGFFFTGENHESLIHRPKSGHDHSIPSGNGIAARNLFRLYLITGEKACFELYQKLHRLFSSSMEENPFGFGSFLRSVEYEKNSCQVVLAAQRREDLLPWTSRLGEAYLPYMLLMTVVEGEGEKASSPLVSGKTAVGGAVTAYVCRGSVCSAPVASIDQMMELLSKQPS